MNEVMAADAPILNAGDGQAVLPQGNGDQSGDQTLLESVPANEPEPLSPLEGANEDLVPDDARLDGDEPASTLESATPEPEPVAVYAAAVSAPEISDELTTSGSAASEHAGADASAFAEPSTARASTYSTAARLLEKISAQHSIWVSYVQDELGAKLAYGRVLAKSQTPVDIMLATNAECSRSFVAANNLMTAFILESLRAS
ncbi:hypothetical protein QA634_06390 [Methylobacterium sp. CB376]|uniref:hypothetical protein n=1 Tax=unclassified Methylobacterium TaxID=2615210 RepID=UPI002240879B|nr:MULTISPECIES: hypothetical protein [Methylobacterium]WFT81509.1 hypothetical protein QA634_06390 [Methylobacterium nodulans]